MKDCIFCKIINGEIPTKKVYEDEDLMVIMDNAPQVDGHVLIIPKKHVADFTLLDEELRNKIYDVANKMTKELMSKLDAKGLTMAVNYGDSQSVKHFHLHLMPDYLIKEKSRSVDEVYEIIK